MTTHPTTKLTEFRHLLEIFQTLPKTPRNLTFMQVSGYPHYENVCSNILAFFLDPEEEHGLGDLLLQSLVTLHSKAEAFSIDPPVNITREYYTTKGKRIDLMIECDNCVIAIENKIHHSLVNDLGHYAWQVDELARQAGKAKFKFVLGLNPILHPLVGDFESITYRQLWAQVESDLGPKLSKSNQKWIHHLLDFIQTTKSMTPGEALQLTETDQFLIKHNDILCELMFKREQLLDRLNRQISRLLEMVNEDTELRAMLSADPGMWKKSLLYLQFLYDGVHTQSVELYVTPQDFVLRLKPRGNVTENIFDRLLQSKPLPDLITDRNETMNKNHVIHKFSLDTALTTLHDALRKVMKSLRSMSSLPEA